MKKFSVAAAILTLACAGKPGGFKDNRDQRSYKTATVAGTLWMAENLEWPVPGSEFYNRKSGSPRVYRFTEAQKACPQGWRLPKVSELIALFSRYGKISYSGDKKEFTDRFGEYAPQQTALTYYKLTGDSEMNFPAVGPDTAQGHRSMVWSGEVAEPGRVYAIYWRGVDEYIEHTSVHFSSYPVEYFGFIRCVKES